MQKHTVAATWSPASLWRTTDFTTETRHTIYLNFLAFPFPTSPDSAIYNPPSLSLPIHSHHIQPSLKTHTVETNTWHPPSLLRTRISLFHFRFSLSFSFSYSFSLSLYAYTFIWFPTPQVGTTRGSTHPSDDCYAVYHPFKTYRPYNVRSTT